MKKYTGNPVTYDELVKDLKAAGIEEGQTIIVHASLSQIGWVVGGSETLIRALLSLVGKKGTLMMPSQTWKNLDPSTGVHWEQPEEWWEVIRQNWPAYDKLVTPAIGMGQTSEMLRIWPTAQRSDHPARSFAAVGIKSDYLTRDHDLENIFGEGSPLSKLYELDGHILLLGVGHNKNTSLHLAETRAEFTKKYTKESSAMMINGKREWVTYETLDVDDEDFLELGADFNWDMNIKTHKVGNADTLFIKQRNLVDYAVKWMEKNRK